jgi:hypothetical protein
MPSFPLPSRSAALFLGAALLLASLPAHAQAPAGRAGRGAQDATPPLSNLQQLALQGMNIPDALTGAATAAATALTRASLTVPANPADLAARAQDLANAELAVAQARASAFEAVQAGLRPLTPDQAANYARGNAGGGRGGRGGATSWETAYNDRTGYVALFDGRTLTGWSSEANQWDVQDGAIHRHQTVEPKNFVDFGQYHLHFAGAPGLPGPIFSDFDLKVEFRIKSGNAGVQYRGRLESMLRRQDNEAPLRPASGNTPPVRNAAAAIADPLGKPLPAGIKTLDDALKAGLMPEGFPYGNGTGHPWQVSGYQFDIYATPSGNTGSLYEGQGRGVSANTGEVVQFGPNGTRTIIARAADLPAMYYKEGDWNKIEIIARGNTMVHLLNGHVVMVATDDDPERRALKGIISLQLEGPQDNEVWYRNIYIKPL